MAGWAFRSSSARRMPARWRSCWSAISALLDRDPWLIVPNRADVELVERDLLDAGRRSHRRANLDVRRAVPVPGRAATLEAVIPVGRSSPAPVVRCSCGVRPRERPDVPSSTFPGYAEALGVAIGEVGAALLDEGELTGELGAVAGAYRAELDTLGLWDRDALRRAAVERLTGDLRSLGRPTGARVRVRGPDRRGVAPDRGARRPRRGARLAARTSRDASCTSRSRARPTTWLHSPTDVVRLPAGGGAAPACVAGASRASPVRRRPAAHPARRRGPLPRGRRPPCDARAGRRGGARARRARGRRPRRSPSSRRRSSLCGGPSRRRSPGWAFPSRSRRRPGSVTRRSVARSSTCCASRGRARTARRCTDSCARRSPASRAATSTSSRAGCAGARSPIPERVVEVSVSLRGGRPLPLLDDLREADDPIAACRAARRIARPQCATGRRSPRRPTRPQPTCARSTPCSACSTSSIVSVLSACACRRDDVVAALERATVRGARPGEPGRVAVLDLMRARTRRFDTVFVLGLEQGSLPRRTPASPFLDDDARRDADDRLGSPPGAPGAGVARPLPVRHGLHATDEEARPRP